MKTRFLIIIGCIVIVTIIGVFFYLSAFSYFTPNTTENLYGIEARVMIQSTYFSPPVQPKGPIEPQDALWFRYNTKLPVDLLEFTVCNGTSCITHYSGNGPPSPELSGYPEKWAGGTLGDMPWKVGDVVHIWVKASPVVSENEKLQRLNNTVSNIDLGESKIIHGGTIRI